MKKNILLVASGSFMALHGASALAQQEPQHAEHANSDAPPTVLDPAASRPQTENRGIDVLPRTQPGQDGLGPSDVAGERREQPVEQKQMDHSQPTDEKPKAEKKKPDPL